MNSGLAIVAACLSIVILLADGDEFPISSAGSYASARVSRSAFSRLSTARQGIASAESFTLSAASTRLGRPENPLRLARRHDSQGLAELEVAMSKQPSLRDVDNRLAEISADGDPLEKLSATVDFERFRPILETAAGRPPRREGRAGRPEAGRHRHSGLRLKDLHRHRQEAWDHPPPDRDGRRRERRQAASRRADRPRQHLPRRFGGTRDAARRRTRSGSRSTGRTAASTARSRTSVRCPRGPRRPTGASRRTGRRSSTSSPTGRPGWGRRSGPSGWPAPRPPSRWRTLRTTWADCDGFPVEPSRRPMAWCAFESRNGPARPEQARTGHWKSRNPGQIRPHPVLIDP